MPINNQSVDMQSKPYYTKRIETAINLVNLRIAELRSLMPAQYQERLNYIQSEMDEIAKRYSK